MMTTEEVNVGQLIIRYLRDGSADKQIGAFELLIPPGAKVPPPHSHTENEEYIYVLDGKIRYSVNQITRELGAGDSMSTPKGAVHSFSNPYEEPARALVVLSPDIGVQYFRDVAAIINAGGPPDRDKLLQVMARYGLRLPQEKPASAR